MTGETIRALTVVFSFILSLLSSLFALISGGDLFFIIVERFFIVFVVSASISWITLNIINSIIIGAATESIEKLIKDGDKGESATSGNILAIADALKHAKEDDSKGTNLDLTSEPQGNMLFTDDIQNETASPEIAEFEPFKPKRIDTDKDNVAQ